MRYESYIYLWEVQLFRVLPRLDTGILRWQQQALFSMTSLVPGGWSKFTSVMISLLLSRPWLVSMYDFPHCSPQRYPMVLITVVFHRSHNQVGQLISGSYFASLHSTLWHYESQSSGRKSYGVTHLESPSTVSKVHGVFSVSDLTLTSGNN